jgi:uncharacterized protein YfaS (alpha-2-macroglobulin family)
MMTRIQPPLLTKIPNKKVLNIYLIICFFVLFSFHFVEAAPPNQASWDSVEQLLKNQKISSAARQIDQLLEQAKQQKNNKNWRQALLLGAVMRFQQGKYEGAVEFLDSQAWPKDQDSEILLKLHRAALLSRYVARFQWEIQQREKIASGKKVPLKKKTMKQLQAEINQDYFRAWRLARARSGMDDSLDTLGALSLASIKSVFSKGDYPKNVRGGVMDTITYLWVDFLKNSSYWSPSHSNQSAGLSVKQLLAYPKNIRLEDSRVHPLKRAVKLLVDLENFERSRNKPEAALEAFRVKIKLLEESRFYQPPYALAEGDRKLLVGALQTRLKQANGAALPWRNMLLAKLAELIRGGEAADANIRALKVLEQCVAQFQKHPATKFCQYQIVQIKRPEMSLQGMRSDGFGKRSLQLTHRNISKVYFRAWNIPLQQALKDDQYALIQKLLSAKSGNSRKHDVQWQVTLAQTRDYKNHISYITPPMKKTGYWLIAASYRADFKKHDKKNVIASTYLNVTRLAVDIRKTKKTLELTTYIGESGQIAAKVQAELWQVNNKSAQRIAVKQTSTDGRASFDITPANHSRLRLVLKHGNDFVLLGDTIRPVYQYYNPPYVNSALIFTDRAIYRPGQKIKWKIVAYAGNRITGKYKVVVNNPGTVKLLDSNGKQVQVLPFKTNQYGSASGEFIAKAGLKLGTWGLQASWGNAKNISNKTIRVEEYKRPTFSASIEKSKQALRLNQAALLTGSARYFFGQPVSSARVKWRVERQMSKIQPYWYGYRYPVYSEKEIIKTGSANINDKGQFTIRFKPTGKASSKQNYRFTIIADITDAGGETRTAKRSFTIGNVAIQASINSDQGYVDAGKALLLKINRHDLDESPRAGVAHWRLNRVQQPAKPLLPAQLPRELTQNPYQIAGDKLQPRWSSMPDFQRMAKDWKDAAQLAQGTLRHNEQGDANLKLNALPAGLYRLHYSTKDRWGKIFKLEKMILVGGKSAASIKTPLLLRVQKQSVEAGDKIKLLVGSGFTQSPVLLEIYQGAKLLKRSVLRGGIKQIEYPVSKANRGSLTILASMLKDYQLVRQQQVVYVPWTDRFLDVSFSTFRDKLSPGQKETWRVTVKDPDGKPLGKGAAEVLASMFDKSLEFFAKHTPQTTQGLYQTDTPFFIDQSSSLGMAQGLFTQGYSDGSSYPKSYSGTRLFLINGGYAMQMAESALVYHDSRSGSRPRPVMRAPAPRRAAPKVDVYALQRKLKARGYYKGPIDGVVGANVRNKLMEFMNRGGDSGNGVKDIAADFDSAPIRKNFNETAFFYPHLVLEDNGSVAFEFEVPESLTQWKVWVSALTKDLRGGTATEFATTSKELMVRPYLPRFLRSGDRAEIEVLVNNSGKKPLSGKLEFDVIDPETKKSLSARYKLVNTQRNFKVAAGQSSRLRFSLQAPRDLGLVAIRARATATNGKSRFGDGEQRPLPILPSRIHLSQSRFAAVVGKNMAAKGLGQSTRQLNFSELAKNTDASRVNDSLVVTVDGQLFYSTLKALPYLTDYPYECTEQTMNRFLSTSIINRVFAKNPALASLAKNMSKRKSQFENWSAVDKDPNRKMLLEETPWLNMAKGGSADDDKLIRVLDPKVARAQYQSAMKKLQKSQTPEGGFPWWQGGRASPYMTAYLLHGFSRALEFKVSVPKPMVQRAWKYLHNDYLKNHKGKKEKNRDYHIITLTNYVLSAYPDNSWSGGVFSAQDRKTMLDYSFKHWRKLPPMLKAYLSLTLKRAGRTQQAKLVFDSIMDNAKTDKDLGTYFAPEDRSWLWYNDRVDSHAFILRALMEIAPNDTRRHGLAQWLMLNKKLNHWKSTRATAEAIYALVYYLKRENQLGKEERATIKIGNHLSKQLVFKPNEYTGNHNQLVVKGDNIKPDMANIHIANQGESLMFASATWHFSTEKLPKSAQGDFFHVSRRFYKRVIKGKQQVLQPLAEGATISVGDELEVQLSLRAKHNAEYVHLRAPRGAGFEPVSQTSSYKWQTGLGYFEEIRDSGANYFFDRLPAGEYRFKYRLRASTAGQFRVAPATVQSIYAPEFNAYSSGKRLTIQ